MNDAFFTNSAQQMTLDNITFHLTAREQKTGNDLMHTCIADAGELFTMKPDWFNDETTIACICEFFASHSAEDGKHLYIVMDNVSWHKKAKRLINEEGRYADIKETATIISLPPYSPDLNPIEQVWRVTRREKTHNRFGETLEKLVRVHETTLMSHYGQTYKRFAGDDNRILDFILQEMLRWRKRGR